MGKDERHLLNSRQLIDGAKKKKNHANDQFIPRKQDDSLVS